MRLRRFIVLFVVLGALSAVLGVKVLQDKPAISPAPESAIERGVSETSPGTLLLFNRNMGCQCAMKLYAAADSYFNKMDPELAEAFHALRINADESPDLAEVHNIIVAPTMIILDSEGREVLRQESKIDIQAIEGKLRELLVRQGDA